MRHRERHGALETQPPQKTNSKVKPRIGGFTMTHKEERSMIASKARNGSTRFIAALACIMLAGSISAFAVPATQVSQALNFVTFAGKCCSLWNQTVAITEPAAVVPVVVTWSADVFLNDEFIVGLSLNGGSCIAYGSREIPWLQVLGGSGILNATHQWVLLPSDGLKKGKNTFTLCGGGANSSSDTIDVGLSSLVVQISK
jgi:hypothetical protein